MAETIRIKKGLDIPLKGMPSSSVTDDTKTTLFAICPDDFPGHTWKALVKAGDSISAGQPLLSDKATGLINLVSPVSGKVEEVHRGERRHIEFISVSKQTDDAPAKLAPSKDGRQIKEAMLASGLWAMMRQRPYDIVPAPDVEPRDIFVTAFDSAPLAPALLTKDLADWLEKGLEALTELTKGKVYVGVRAGSGIE